MESFRNQADALFIQGLRDVLFPLNHGLANWNCAREAGQHAYLVAIQDGHIMPWLPATNVPQAAEQPVTGGVLRPAFIPLYRAREGDFLAGIPRL